MSKKLLLGGGALATGLLLGRAVMPVDLFTKDRLNTGSTALNATANLMYLGKVNNVSTQSFLGSATSYASQVLSEGMPFGKAMGWGSAAGGIAGGTLGLLMQRGAKAKLKGGFGGALVGAAVGLNAAYKATNAMVNLGDAVFKKVNRLNPQIDDKRSFGYGSGFRSWAKSPGRRMPVGHLGATGDLVTAMHKVRNRKMY